MKKLLILGVLTLAFANVSIAKNNKAFVKENFEFIEAQLPVAFKATDAIRNNLKKAGKLKSGLREPAVMRTVDKNGKLRLVGPGDWTSGFFPGLLWYVYEYTKDESIRAEAEKYTARIAPAQFRKTSHDVGFIINCSFGNGYRLTQNKEYKAAMIQAAKSLSTRFNPVVGCIKSWDHSSGRWPYSVIIDNMMNLELLCEATKLSGDTTFMHIAKSHATKTMENHFREDFSCYHVLNYDTKTGLPNKKNTHQGYAHSSAWARGQGWALYGYTMMYRETGEKKFLENAKNVASFILNHPRLPKDKVPYWDFDDPKIPNVPRDVSAGALMASALYELSDYVKKESKNYIKSADIMMESISKKYRAEKGGDFGFITLHSVGSLPSNSEVDVPLNYADYYFVEALIRKERILNGEKVYQKYK